MFELGYFLAGLFVRFWVGVFKRWFLIPAFVGYVLASMAGSNAFLALLFFVGGIATSVYVYTHQWKNRKGGPKQQELVRTDTWPPQWSQQAQPQATAQTQAAAAEDKGADISQFRVAVEPDPDAFEKVVGMQKAKTELRDALELPLLYSEKIEKYSLKPASGLILYGPPGTGKTHLARAAAAFFEAEFYVINASSVSSPQVGSTEATIREIFKEAKAKTPSIIFFDEIDVIGAKRDGQGLNRPSDLALNTLLTELDGFKKREGVFVVAATNRLDMLDEALIRPGRFELKIEIPAPNEDERIELLKFFSKDKPIDPTLDLRTISMATEGMTGAYLEGLTNAAAKRALKREIASRKNEFISYEDFISVLPEIRNNQNN